MTLASLDTIAVRQRPLPGEAIDSWLEAYASRLQTGVLDIFALAGLAPAGTRTASTVAGRGLWIYSLTPAEAAALSALTAVPASALSGMTLTRYHPALVTVGPATRLPGPSRWWRQTAGSRYCPGCLAATGGRWQLSWRLPWSFACPLHQMLLADACPACGRPARQVRGRLADIPQPGRCRARAPAGGTPCRELLAGAATPALPADGLILRAQRHIDTIISELPRGGAAARAPLLGSLDDIHAIIHASLSALRVPAILPAPARQALAELGDQIIVPGSEQPRWGQERCSPPMAAFGAAVAVHMLRGGPACPDPVVARWLTRAAADYKARRNLPGGPAARLLKRWKKATPALQNALLKTLDPQLAVRDRLRYATPAATPAPPARGTGQARAPAVPSLLWPSWALRLNPCGLFDPLPYRAILSVLLLLAASHDTRYHDAQALLGHHFSSSGSSGYIAPRLQQAGALDAVLSALSELARKLDEHGAPIDYARRRALFNPAPFNHQAWREHCDHIGYQRHRRQENTARILLTELLTGNHPRYFPPPHNLSADDCFIYARVVFRLPAQLLTHLHDQATQLLSGARIDEPVHWEPPFGWLPGARWPGPHPDDIPAARMWQLIHAGHSRTTTAAKLGTSIEHIRLIAARHPQPIPQRQPAPRTTIPRTAVSQRIDPDWFTRQYVTKGRTLADISRDVKITPNALARYVHQLGITPRRGGAGHRNPLNDIGEPDGFPPATWAAFQRSGGCQRIRRFLTVIKHPTFSQASRQLGTSPSVISTQIAQLERDLGAQLIIRNPGHCGITMTAEGRRFAHDARRLLARIDHATGTPHGSSETQRTVTAEKGQTR